MSTPETPSDPPRGYVPDPGATIQHGAEFAQSPEVAEQFKAALFGDADEEWVPPRPDEDPEIARIWDSATGSWKEQKSEIPVVADPSLVDDFTPFTSEQAEELAETPQADGDSAFAFPDWATATTSPEPGDTPPPTVKRPPTQEAAGSQVSPAVWLTVGVGGLIALGLLAFLAMAN